MINIKVLAATVAIAAAPGLASAAVLDNFSVFQRVQDAPSTTAPSSNTVGARTFTIDATPNPDAVEEVGASKLTSRSQTLQYSNDDGFTSLASVDWAFSGLDLSNGTAFTIDLLNYDQATSSTTLTLLANGTGVSKSIGQADIGTLSFDFASFGGVDFSNISSLGLALDSVSTNAFAVDLALDNFAYTEVAPIPVPAAGLLLLGGLGALGAIKRRKA